MNASLHTPLPLLWTCVLLPPFAWAACLGLLFVLTDQACLHGSLAWLIATGVLCIGLAAAGGVLAYRRHARTSEAHGDADYERFMLEIAIGLAAVFTLVNIVSTVPVFLLSACPQ
jgi:hypothetical protein